MTEEEILNVQKLATRTNNLARENKVLKFAVNSYQKRMADLIRAYRELKSHYEGSGNAPNS